MREAARWSTLVIVVWAALWAVPQAAAAGGVWSGPSASTITASTGTAPEPTPESDTPDTTEPDSTTATTEPDDSTPDTSIDDALVGAGEPDSDIDTTTAAIAVVGFVALLVLASWWMVRRSDPDAAPMPPQRPSDLI
jgi:hypothetical protein